MFHVKHYLRGTLEDVSRETFKENSTKRTTLPQVEGYLKRVYPISSSQATGILGQSFEIIIIVINYTFGTIYNM